MGTIADTNLESQLKYITLLDSDKATAHYQEYFFERGKSKRNAREAKGREGKGRRDEEKREQEVKERRVRGRKRRRGNRREVEK